MKRNYMVCPQCNSARYETKSLILSDHGEEFIQKCCCRRCRFLWEIKLSLVSDSNKYVYIWDSERKVTVQLHRWVWMKANGRELGPHEIVHHNNQNPGDNRLCNLTMMSKYDHARFDHDYSVVCKKCGHKWVPKLFKPRICPVCKSPHWNEDKKKVADK